MKEKVPIHNIVLKLHRSRIQTTVIYDTPASPISSNNSFELISYNPSTVSSSEDFFYLMRCSHKNKFLEDVHNTKVEYRKIYRDLPFRERLNREESVAKDIIGSCANKGKLMQDGYEYLQKNRQVAIDCLNMLDRIKCRIEYEIKIKFEDVSQESMTDCIDGLCKALLIWKEISYFIHQTVIIDIRDGLIAQHY